MDTALQSQELEEAQVDHRFGYITSGPEATPFIAKGELMGRLLAINGWNVGFNKIRLTNTLRAEFGYPLSEAKSITDQVLENREVRIPFDRDPSLADDLVKRLREIGAKASIVDE